ncbi:MAG: sigma-70 family RNA polymerase sigma factor [Chitinophagaceae bacterium]
MNELEQGFQHTNTMTSYLREIDRIPLLTRKEEELLTSTYGTCCQEKRKGNPEYVLCPNCTFIKNKLITSNLRFVVSVAKKYHNNTLSLADLINEGNLGLLTAVDKFDHTLGYHFISYAVWWIKQSILKAISEKSRMIRVPMNRTNDLFKIAKFIHEYTRTFSRKPLESEIEAHIGIPRKDILRILNISAGHTSLEELTTNENSEYNDIADTSFSPEQNVLSHSLNYGIIELLNALSERERFILIHRFGLHGQDPLSLSKIGILLGITKERVRQLEKQALASIKKLAHDKQMILYFFE